MMEFDSYFTNEALDEVLDAWAKRYPKLISLQSLGSSYEKRPIWVLILTNQDTGPDLHKPAVWIDANIHATEITGTTTALAITEALLSGYGQEEQATRLLDTCTYYIVPRVNPDGAALAMAERPRFIRSGVRPYPWDEVADGLHEEDIDGDGRILQMRIPDPSGDWKISSQDPRLMQKRSPVEYGGQYYRLLPEGKIKNYDGAVITIAPDPSGLDFNRNFPFEWRPENEQSGAGPYPASEPEIKALADFIAAHPNINLAITYHTFSRVILRPFSTRPDDEMETSDLWVLKKIGAIGTELTGYRCVSTFHDFKYHPKETTSGAFDDWMYDHFGAYAFTIELWDLPSEAGIEARPFIEWFRDHPHEEDLQILKWADAQVGPQAYIDWYPCEHPQLGSIELGGWHQMYTWRNPPAPCLAAEVTRNIPFALTVGDLLPHLEIKALDVTKLGDERYRLVVVVENSGFLPSYTSEQAKKRKAARPIRIELDLPEDARLLTGKIRVELSHLEGRSNKLDSFALWGTAGTDNRTRSEWVIKAPQGSSIELQVRSERAGSLIRQVRLE
jgi:murein tripeptide amidase MpaA